MMASTKSKSKMKQQAKAKQGKSKTKPPRLQVHSDKDVDLEDSGVHLEEPLTPGKLEQFFLESPSSMQSSTVRLQMTQSHSSSVQSSMRVSKSESPQPCFETIESDFSRLTVTASSSSTSKNRNRLSPPEDGRIHFSVDSDVDSDESSSASRGAVSLSSTTCFTDGASGSSSKPKTSSSTRDHKRSGKGRFKKMLRPLRRSHSAGCSKDVPAHALFLRHEMDRRRDKPERRSLDRGAASMEPYLTDSDSDHAEDSADKSKSKSKKKSLAQDVKEKFSFLRRRHTDTSLSSKDKAGRPSTDVILGWSKSFEVLLQDRYGLEMFRDFLRTEFSEENVEFWIACQEYKNSKSNKLEAQAQKIFTDFVAVQAPREINLDSKTRLLTSNHMSRPNRQTFEVAQKRIEALMEKDSYPRFLHSDVYQELLGDQRYKLNLT